MEPVALPVLFAELVTNMLISISVFDSRYPVMITTFGAYIPCKACS